MACFMDAEAFKSAGVANSALDFVVHFKIYVQDLKSIDYISLAPNIRCDT